MERKNAGEKFIQKIFERANNPLAQLEKINSIVPIFFTNKDNVESANNELDSYGYQVNDEYVEGVRSKIQMFGHPACGSSNEYGNGHSACGNSNSYGGHSACGNGNSYGNGHSACASINKEEGKSLLLIRKNNNGKRNETRVPRFGI